MGITVFSEKLSSDIVVSMNASDPTGYSNWEDWRWTDMGWNNWGTWANSSWENWG